MSHAFPLRARLAHASLQWRPYKHGALECCNALLRIVAHPAPAHVWRRQCTRLMVMPPHSCTARRERSVHTAAPPRRVCSPQRAPRAPLCANCAGNTLCLGSRRSVGFGQEVYELVLGHTQAKRYLVTTDPDYARRVSPASMVSTAHGAQAQAAG